MFLEEVVLIAHKKLNFDILDLYLYFSIVRYFLKKLNKCCDNLYFWMCANNIFQQLKFVKVCEIFLPNFEITETAYCANIA